MIRERRRDTQVPGRATPLQIGYLGRRMITRWPHALKTTNNEHNTPNANNSSMAMTIVFLMLTSHIAGIWSGQPDDGDEPSNVRNSA